MNYKNVIDEATYLKNLCDDMLGYFLESDIYNQMFKNYKQEDFDQVQSLFYENIERMTEIAFKDEEDRKKIENIVIKYLAYLENLHVIIGYKVACKLNR